MTNNPQKPQNAQKLAEQAAEQQRLAKALRDNLHKRKQQQRSRVATDSAESSDNGEA